MDDSVIVKLKEAMAYSDPVARCKNCTHYVPTDCSGSHNAKSEHCTLNPAIDIPVSEGGFCKHFALKDGKAR